MTVSPMAALVRRHDPDRFFTALFAPAEQREALLALYAFNHELARAREVASQPLLALIRLQWWREVVEGTRRRHEVAGPLGEAIDAGKLHVPDLLAMIEAREAETEEAIPDLTAWLGYLSGSAGGLAVAAGRLLGAEELDRARLRALGTAYGVAGQLRSVAVLAAQGRCLLPQDVLGAHGLTPEHVVRSPEAASPVLAVLAEEGRVLLRAGRGRFGRGVIAAALPGVWARRDLRKAGASSGPRRLGDRLAVTWAAWATRV